MAAGQRISAVPLFQLPVHGLSSHRAEVLGHMTVLDDDFTRTVLAVRRWYYAGPHRKYVMSRFQAEAAVKGLSVPMSATVCLSLHRVVFAHYHGAIDKGLDIDHIDRDQINNTPSNLRAVPRGMNNANARTRCDNTSGYRGVSWSKQKGKWRANLSYQGKHIHLCHAETAEEAARAVNEAYRRYYPGVQLPNPLPGQS